MNHADPWDEMARLEKQMEVELLAQREAAPPTAPRAREPGEHTPVPPLEE